MRQIEGVYRKLLQAYGPQGWWPILGWDGTNPYKTGSVSGYHPNDYTFPRTASEQFEICLGAILTQNTAWPNVEKALYNLAAYDALAPEKLRELSDQQLRNAIRPAGYYNVKTRKLREFVRFYIAQDGDTPSRQRLLSVWGIGPETADSMLLYAYRNIEMVVDAYTRRILAHLGMVPPDIDYDHLKTFCAGNLPEYLIVYQEFHALLVEHAKHYYRRRPYRDELLASDQANQTGLY